MAILQISDFANGKYVIPVNPMQDTDLQTYINDVEKTYLLQMFGKELYDLFIADLTGSPSVPQSARFIKIFNAFDDQTNDVLTSSDGMKEMLKGFVYYIYLRDLVNRASTTGLKKVMSENSTNVNPNWYDLNRRYNEAVQTYNVIQNYMDLIDPNNYTEFKGVILNYNQPY